MVSEHLQDLAEVTVWSGCGGSTAGWRQRSGTRRGPTQHVNTPCVAVYYLTWQHTPRTVYASMPHDAALARTCRDASQAHTGWRWWVSAGAQGCFRALAAV
jgi:hypothetical protein